MVRLSVAPMAEWTDRPYRSLARALTRRTVLYTEMVVADDLLHKDHDGQFLLLDASTQESPLVLQLGGAEPETLMRATDVAVSSSHVNYEEINLNCGCPSAAATCCSQRYGASLMHDPHGVATCLRAMARASPNAPVSVKCRLGTNERNGYKLLSDFISIVSSGAGVRHFIIHSRECVLGGFTPKQNRTIPPLRPRWTHQLKQDFPDLHFTYNGGIKSLEMAGRHLLAPHNGIIAEYGSYAGLKEHESSGNEKADEFQWDDLPAVDGVMIGREAYQRPWLLREADVKIFGEDRNPGLTRRKILEDYIVLGEELMEKYSNIHGHRKKGTPGYSTRNLLKPVFGLFATERGGREWRRILDKEWVGGGKLGVREPSLRELLEAAMDAMPSELLDAE
uniref:tRNA-dihydrouridine synthase n=2 Tax=Guillardia theta TaxID=55529 RepID=A0A7S4L9G9_GUITH|mmetsp:Transcript_40351/g.126967  ORF Transcript_40351/g.126967 Transcript_40351/m.126967 type:complete len:393 (+) Transcript_40351:169-1347(+)